MDIVLCSKCGWIGTNEEIVFVNDLKTKIDSSLLKIIKQNNMSKKCCPSCSGSELFFRQIVQVRYNPAELPWPHNFPHLPESEVVTSDNVTINHDPEEDDEDEDDEKNELQDDLVDDILNSASSLEIEDEETEKTVKESVKKKETKKRGRPKKEKAEAAAKKIEPAIPNRLKNIFTCKCDICEENFKNKVPGTTRCDKCLKKTLGNLV